MSSTVSVTSSAAEWQPLEYISGDPSTVSPPPAHVSTERGDVDLLLRVKDAARILSTGPGEVARASVVDTAAPRVAVAATHSSPSAATVDQPIESVRSLRAQFEASPNVVSGVAYNGRGAPVSAAMPSVARQLSSGGAYGKIEETILARNTPVTETEKIMLVIRRATIVRGANQNREKELMAALPVTDDERGHVLIVRPTIVLSTPPATLPVAAGACDAAAAAIASPTSASRDVTSRPGSGHPAARRGPSTASANVASPAAALSPDDEAVSVVTPSQLRRGTAAAAFWPPPPPPTTPADCGSTEVDSGTPRDDDNRLVTPSSLRRGAATAAFWQQQPSSSTPGRSSDAKSPSDFGVVGSSSPMLVPAVAAEQAASPRTASGPATVADAAAVRPFAIVHHSTTDNSAAATSSAGVVTPSGTAAAKASETSSVHYQSPMVFRVPPPQGAAAASPTASGQNSVRESPSRGAAVSRRWNDLSPAGSLPVTDCEKADVMIRRTTIVINSSDARVADFLSHEISELNTRLQVPERPDELTMSDSLSINGIDPQTLSKPFGRALFQIVHSPVTPPTEVVPRFGMTEFVISKRLLAVSECED